MANLDVLYREQSAPIELTLHDEDGVAFDITTMTDIWVNIYHKKTRVTIATFQQSLGDVATVSASDGVIRVILNASDTIARQLGIYACDVDFSEADADYENGIRFSSGSEDIFVLNNHK